MLTYLRRLQGLFDRFDRARPGVAAANAGAVLRDAAGAPAGRLEHALLARDRIAVRGRLEAGAVELVAGGRTARLDRPPGPEGPVPFALTLPLEEGPPPEALLRVPGGPALPLRFPAPWRVRAGRISDFSWRMARLVPALAGWAATRDPRHRGAVKRMLDLEGGTRFGPLDPGLLDPAPPPPAPPVATLVLPVHNGHDLLAACLDRLERHTEGPWRLIAVEDASTDPRVAPLLRDRVARLAKAREALLLEPEGNLGFVGAVNAALEARAARGWDGPVVLVNSDALVPEGWLARLLAPLADPQVASVTPMSNDSEITTAPAICARIDLPPGAADRIDAGLRPLSASAPMPTGVGFCMAMAGPWLERLPRLDPAFGPGYGEEVDWCRKAAALGGAHLGLGGLFVEHRGGGSFGSEAKRALIARNHRLIQARYPSYDAEVQDFLARDPLRGPRLAAALAWAGAVAGTVPVYLAHTLGGGAELWLERRIARDLEAGTPSAVLRVGGLARWQLELHAPGGVTGGTTEDLALIQGLLDLLPRRRIVYSCGVGDPDPAALPETLLGLRREGDGLEVLMHDWFPVSPSYTLLGADGAYRGPVGPGAADPAHRARRPGGRAVPLAEWQAAWGRLMRAADRVVLFSEAGRAVLDRAFPGLARVEVRPHAPPDPALWRVADPPRGGPVLGVLGNVNHHKGADVLDALAAAGGPPIVVLGETDPARPLSRRIRVHGGYAPGAVPDLVRRHGITHWVVPSIWPETFSFVTHEALATGLPVLGFDIGAQGAALRAAPNGTALPFDPDDPAAALRAALTPAPEAPRP